MAILPDICVILKPGTRPKAGVVSIAMDRGFVDGKLLWWLNSKGIIFSSAARQF